MSISKINLKQSIDRETVRSISKLVLIAAWLVFMLYLVTLLPGVNRLVPQTPVTFAALVGAIVTLVIVAVLVIIAPKLAVLTQIVLKGPKTVVECVASVVYWFVMLVAVLVAYRGLAGAMIPFFDGLAWIYDFVFLLLALPIIVIIGARLYATLDPSSDLLAEKLVEFTKTTESEVDGK